MSTTSDGSIAGGAVVSRATLERLDARAAAAAIRAAKTGERTIAAVTEELAPSFDPVAVMLNGRHPGEDWAVVEQPEDSGSLVCGLGCVVDLGGSGAERFDDAAAQWSRLAGGAIADEVSGGPPGSGPVAIGGFSFDGRSRSTGAWRGFGGGSMAVPEIAFARRGGALRITLQLIVGPGEDPAAKVSSLVERVESLDATSSLPTGLGTAVSEVSVESSLPPEHYVAAVGHALDAIDEGRIEKVVLAREVAVERGVAIEPAAVIAALRDRFPSCFVFAVGRGDAVFLGASPELLVRREGLHVSTVALAGTAPRSADPTVTAHLGERLLGSGKNRREQDLVAQRIVRDLESVSVWVSAGEEPQVVAVSGIQHLGTPIRARLREPIPAMELVGRLHPTPAVGGEPWPEAALVLAENEGFDRGWYASPVGWSDVNGNGEFLVALRCALIRGSEARCFAGVGVVEGSSPDDELAETELKLQALLPILSD